jgi:hypothetical protein
MKMNKKVPLMPSLHCDEKKCPFIMDKNGYPKKCSSDCMAWTIVTKGESREDHSGGGEMIRKLSLDYGVEATRKGPGGSMGHWDIPELGYCKRLWPNLDVVTSSDYMRKSYE